MAVVDRKLLFLNSANRESGDRNRWTVAIPPNTFQARDGEDIYVGVGEVYIPFDVPENFVATAPMALGRPPVAIAVATASNVSGTNVAANAIDNNVTTFWQSAGTTYNANGTYNGTVSTTYAIPGQIQQTSALGEWFQIAAAAGESFSMATYTISSIFDRCPTSFLVLGSYDGTNWILYESRTTPTNFPDTSTTSQTFTSTSPYLAAYRFYRFVILTCGNSNRTSLLAPRIIDFSYTGRRGVMRKWLRLYSDLPVHNVDHNGYTDRLLNIPIQPAYGRTCLPSTGTAVGAIYTRNDGTDHMNTKLLASNINRITFTLTDEYDQLSLTPTDDWYLTLIITREIADDIDTGAKRRKYLSL